ncbi:hypothetical protein GCM10011504_05020 [Siccirubricoccus deserti]|uniref:YMGG-like Gly-zipper domain-containing protein n=1 Tax=Siccirubricoccus deserti TaxID=2013562 RepID=A0A9X0UEU9_9PROT|nr:YMGG-like glycine zipper-containing protein [Siccirubricoccus deserti]MBC4013825.1 hypothetical protein [Siccirubricoccus deserti]GGC29802.1 hypothetical protein GCM10011504_05020 [Siccirubricoccus deserti]
MARQPNRMIAIATSAVLLAGCVTTRSDRIGADDGSDSCRQQVVALDSTGNFFAEDILRGAAFGAAGGAALGGIIGGNWRSALIGAAAGAATGAAGGYLAALQQRSADQSGIQASLVSDLSRENAELDRTQLAFNQLMDCRFQQAREVREAYRQGRLPRGTAEAEMTALRARTQRDIALARSIDQRIGTRGAEFETAIESVAPGTKASYEARRNATAVNALARAPVALKLRPEAGAPEIGRLAARQPVRIRPIAPGYALVQTQDGERLGYAEQSAFNSAGGRGVALPRQAEPRAQAAGPAVNSDTRTLAASNIARREGFSESVANAEMAASGGGGFELAG